MSAPAARRQAARELLTRPQSVTRILLDALDDSAEGYRKRAASRRLAGPDLAVHREHYRAHEQACRDLAEMIRQPLPVGLPVAALIADWFMKGGAR